jgi:hypothetical protein
VAPFSTLILLFLAYFCTLFHSGNKSLYNTTLTGNRNNTGVSPAIGWDNRLDPAVPSNNI